LTKHGFPILTPQQIHKASVETLTTLYLLKDVFDRVLEILKEDEKEEEKEKKSKKEEEDSISTV